MPELATVPNERQQEAGTGFAIKAKCMYVDSCEACHAAAFKMGEKMAAYPKTAIPWPGWGDGYKLSSLVWPKNMPGTRLVCAGLPSAK